MSDQDQDAQLDRVARGLLQSDAQLKELAAKDWNAAYDQAVDRAAKQIDYKSPQQLRIARFASSTMNERDEDAWRGSVARTA